MPDTGPAQRTVTLAVVDGLGRTVGTLPLPGPTASPWWQEVDDVVELARRAHGVEVTVLRLLCADAPSPPGGHVTYLAEYDGPPPAGLVAVDDRPEWTAPHSLRMPWGRPGGPAASLAWAERVLRDLGRTVHGRQQRRSWNLSSIWRLDTDAGPAWLKEVPPFFAHEAAVIRWLGRPTTPVVLGADRPTAAGRLLLADVPGTDRYDADGDERAVMLAEMMDIQADSAARLPELLALGVPDGRAGAFVRQAEELVAREEHRLSEADRAAVHDLVAGLPARFAALAECGVPDTLVHGDFHPGNVRSDGSSMVIIDWGDCLIGHPVLDLLRLRDWEFAGPAPELAARWCEFWRRTVPGCDPERVLDLIGPIAALRGALVYGAFVRAIEPSEHGYHAADVLTAMRAAIASHRTS
jgi:hypothetical protein